MPTNWYKDAVIYQIHVRSFFDSNDDGYGDFEGVRRKLPYLADLGVNTLWLLPFYESPLRDDGYDIADYYRILPVHGDLEAFKAFLEEAHERGFRVITELVLNHTSDQHEWFQESRQPGSARRDWYVWSDTALKYEDVRIIFTDAEHSNWTWDTVAGAYYWHRFFSHQPDLNWDNPDVERAMHEVMFHWLDMGVDGLRLDAVPYLYEREGTSSENLPETIEAIKRLRKAMDERYGGEKILLAEANQWPEDTLPYFGVGDGVQMAFNFPVMPRLYLALRREVRRPIVEMLQLTEDIPEAAQWAIFLRNHDELTLEMVTDEERDFMYNEYATDRQFRVNVGIRRRLAPLLGGERRRIELMNALLLSLPGSPVIYYGDEIGMGDNTFLGDRNGVRTPMQWSGDRNGGFSRAPFHQLFLPTISDGRYSYHSVNVEEASNDPHSLYHFTRRLLAIRNQRSAVFGRGGIHILDVDNPHIFAFVREHEGHAVLVVANLSRFAQSARLPMQEYAGRLPVELFSRAPFPPFEGSEYLLTVGPHGFYWFALEDAVQAWEEAIPAPTVELPQLPLERRLPSYSLAGGLETVLVPTMVRGRARAQLEEHLPEYLLLQRWFGGKGRKIHGVQLEDAVRLQREPSVLYLCSARVNYEDQTVERYNLPLATVRGEDAEDVIRSRPRSAIAWLVPTDGDAPQLLVDATSLPDFWLTLYLGMRRGWKGRSLQGAYLSEVMLGDPLPGVNQASVLGVEQSNSSALLGEALFGKLYRKLGEGPNPEAELLQHLTAVGFPFVPRLRAELRFRRGALESTLVIIQDAVRGEGDAWAYAVREFGRYLDRVANSVPPEDLRSHSFGDPVPAWVEEAALEVLELASLLGVRTAELHSALAKAEGEALAPEPTRQEDLREFAMRVRGEAQATQSLLALQDLAVPQEPLDRGLKRLEELARTKPDWHKIRIHGDYHLGQVLEAEGEFYILDFEGEPGRTPAERRRKDQALRDVAGMLRSLDYAGLMIHRERAAEASEAAQNTRLWTTALTQWSEWVFLDAYLSTLGFTPGFTVGSAPAAALAATPGQESSFLPNDPATRDLLLWAYQLDKVLYEVRYELGSRPDWVGLPLQGLKRLLGDGGGASQPA